MLEVKIEVEKREGTGKGVARRLRAEGFIPGVVYGGGKETVPIQLHRKTLLDLFKEGGHENRIFLLQLAGTGKSRHAMIRDLQIDPVSQQIAHIDFQRILLTDKLKVKVHIELQGLPVGVKNEAGILDFITREVEVECLPTNIPPRLTLDVSDLHIGQHLEAKDLPLPEGVALVGDPSRPVAAVAHSRVEAVEEAAPTTEMIEAEAAEPEVIRRGKPTEEGEES